MSISSRAPLIGSWIKRGTAVVADDVEVEIERRLREELRLIASSGQGWSQLLVDDTANEYWELTYPQSQLHGGGPKLLSPVAKDVVQTKYNI